MVAKQELLDLEDEEVAEEEEEKGFILHAMTEAEKPLVLQQMKLVYRLAWRLKNVGHAAGLNKEDLINEGFIGLLRAWRKFKPGRGSFRTHAYWWIRAAMTRAISNSAATHGVRIPCGTGEKIRRLRKKAQAYIREHRTEPDLEVVAGWFPALSPRGVKDLLAASQFRAKSLETPDTDDLATLAEQLPSTSTEEAVMLNSNRQKLVKTLETLPERQRFVMQAALGFTEQEYASLREIAEKMDVSYQSVQQTRNKAESRLKAIFAE